MVSTEENNSWQMSDFSIKLEFVATVFYDSSYYLRNLFSMGISQVVFYHAIENVTYGISR